MRFPTVKTQYPIKTPKIKIVFCGEAAGGDEEKCGQPFIGRAGKLLDKILQDAKIPRQYVLITNVFQLRPPDNKIMEFFTKPAVPPPFIFHNIFQGAGVNYELWGEIARLIGELHLFQPHIIVALGNTALWAITNNEGITQHRGKLHNCALPSLSHIPVMPTFHPSYLLRKEQFGKEYQEMVNDIIAAKNIAICSSHS